MKTQEEYEAFKKKIYPVTLSFTKRFTRGLLEGLTHSDTLRFVDVESACRWIAGVTENSSKKRLDYRLVCYHFE